MFFFLPTGSTAETSRKPLVTMSLAATCVAVFAWSALVEPRPRDAVAFREAEAYARERPYLVDPDSDGDQPERAEFEAQKREFETLLMRGADRSGGAERRLSLVPRRGVAQVGWLTNLFVHFNLMHLLGNLLFLWLVGPLLEEAWGRRRFLAFYLAAGLVASLVQFFLERTSPASIGGASGAIAGCMGAFTLRFAATKIRFHYFLWFIRIFMGSVHVPAWLCGLLWFGRELLDLEGGGAAGVATGAHVGGFVLGGMVALSMRALGSEKTLLTVAESAEERARRTERFADAQSALSRGDSELARESLTALQREAPDYPGAAMLLAEVDVHSQRGLARLEKVLRPLLARPEQASEVRTTLHRLWPAIDARGFSPAFAWQLAEQLRAWRSSEEMIAALLEAVAGGTGALAIKARALLDAAPPREVPAHVEVEAPDAPVSDDARVLPVTLVAAKREGLEVIVNGVSRLVPFQVIAGVHGGLVGRALWVDVLIHQSGPRTALRLSGADPFVPTLFPGTPVPKAWQDFIAATRRAAGVQPGSAPWEHFESVDALTASWATAN